MSPAPEFARPDQVNGAYKDLLVRLMTRQIYAETATAEVFGKAISVAPNWKEKALAAEFAAEEARHSQGLYDLLLDLGEDPEAIVNRYLTEMRGHMEGTGLVFPPLAAFDAIQCELALSSRDILLSLQAA